MAVQANSTPAPAIPPAIHLTRKADAYIARALRPKGCPPGVDPARWRKAVAKRIERHHAAADALIAALDAMDGDADLEPSLAGFDGLGDDREGDDADNPAGELVDEDGGDVQDERHDATDEGNDEPDRRDDPAYHNIIGLGGNYPMTLTAAVPSWVLE